MSVSQAQFALYKAAIIAERLRRMQVFGPLEAIAARVLELDPGNTVARNNLNALKDYE